ncbi:hypothetical protein B0T18DRAFT_429804 [Schizothecium vesticola]|uniref:Uncharacterized protein n=1 Tax=Schizothecium vesticola TaxID=314040 RepID=A0AA40K5Q6_9PEZI|nr:hypothetical protein B0T18DRAFT_429804 [Schizothecium vesticola]
MATTKTRDPTCGTSRGSTHAASPIPITPTKATSARILSEDRTTRRRKYTIFWPGREDETEVVPAPDILKYVTMGYFRAFRVGVEAARSQRRTLEKLEEENRRDTEKTKMAAREKVKESLGLKQAVVGEGVDVESSSDSDIGYYLKPKGSIKKTPRVIDRRQERDKGRRSTRKHDIKKKRKAPATAQSKKRGWYSGDKSLNTLAPEQSPYTKKTTRLSLGNKGTNLLEDSTGNPDSTGGP